MLVNPTGFLNELNEHKLHRIDYIYVMRGNIVRINFKGGFHMDITPKLVKNELKYHVDPNNLFSEEELIEKLIEFDQQ
jgi:hypothetical protein